MARADGLRDAIAVIPARGGSKRIPRKNVKLFHGRPMIAWSIEAAKRSRLFARIIVSTDCEDIAQVARQHGAEVPFRRPAALANDHAGTDEVLLHALRWLEVRQELPSLACCIYPTAPFLTPESLALGLAALEATKALTAFPVARYSPPIQRALQVDAQGFIGMVWPEHRDRRSQDLTSSYHDAGQFYWVRSSSFLERPLLYTDRSAPVVLSRREVVDIDEPEDWELAEALMAAREASVSAISTQQ